MSRFLLTGCTGCVGAATISYLLDRGVEDIVGMSRSDDLARILPTARSRLSTVRGDVSSASEIETVIEKVRPTHLVHLAGFQTPDCQSQPFRGMDVNVMGTANTLKAAARVGSLERVVFASSAAVYGARDLYPDAGVPNTGPYAPPSLYGHWKLCGEGICQAFHAETEIPTLCLRFASTYGPGRDRGLTAAPTTAIKSVALSLPYAMPYQGREHYHYVRDVAAGFGEAALHPFSGYGAFNLRGTSLEVRDFLGLLRDEAQRQGVGGSYDVRLDENTAALPLISDLDASETLKTFPAMTLTDLRTGVAESLAYFREMVARGELTGASL